MAHTPANPPPLLTPAEVAEQLRVSTMTVRRLIAAGDLPAYRFGRQVRIEPSDLDTYLARRRVSA